MYFSDREDISLFNLPFKKEHKQLKTIQNPPRWNIYIFFVPYVYSGAWFGQY